MFIVQLNKDTWRSRCCFGVTSYKERAARFETEKGAKISLARLRRHRGDKAYPDAEVKKITWNDEARRKYYA